MTLAPDDPDDPVRPPRPVVLPTFRLPTRLAEPLSWGLLVAAVAAIVSGLVTAVSYDAPALPTQNGANSFVGTLNLFQPVGFADRLALFARNGASMPVALLVLVAVVVTAMADSSRRWHQLLVTLGLAASIVVLGNLVLGVATLTARLTFFTAPDSTDRVTAVLNLLPQALTAVAALAYAVIRLRTSGEADEGLNS